MDVLTAIKRCGTSLSNVVTRSLISAVRDIWKLRYALASYVTSVRRKKVILSSILISETVEAVSSAGTERVSLEERDIVSEQGKRVGACLVSLGP